MGKTFFEWLWEKEQKNKREWEPVPLELPIDDDEEFIIPPTTSSADIETTTTMDLL